MIEREWSSKDLLGFAPVIATSFAFAFNVGYFLAIDIAWFSLFSLSEHMVFALRALPIGIAASFIFVFGHNFPPVERRPRWLSICSRWVWRIWFLILLGAGFYSLSHYRFAIGLTFFVVAFATIIHYTSRPPKMSFVNVGYWVGTAFFVTLIVGYVSALSWPFFHNQQRSVITAKNAETLVATLILTGERGVLIYVPDAEKQSDLKKPTTERPRGGLLSEGWRVLTELWPGGRGRIRLVRWDNIEDISLCPASDPQCALRQNQSAAAPLH